jgi:predicted nucleic acid-binding protein
VILVDTSVWIRHLRAHDARLAASLHAGGVAMHPFVMGELACGHLFNRGELLAMWSRLPAAPVATTTEALHFIEAKRLMGLGLGYIDVHLLASAAIAGVKIWTTDRAMSAAAARIGIAYNPAQ